MYFVVVCGAEDARLPALPALSLFDDGRQSLYGDYTRALLREKQLAWEEIDARRTAEDRLAELIKATNDLASEREKSATLADRVEALEEAYREQAATTSQRLKSLETAYDASRAELTAEREYSTSLMWEERNARGVAEGRLSELITAVNDLSSEREKSASLAARVSSLETALTTAQQRNAELVWDERNWCKIAEERLAQLNATVADLQSERERANALMWEERNSRNVAEERLTQIVAARARTEALEATVATMQAELTQTRAALAHAHTDIQRWSAAVMEAQSRQMLAENALAQAREDLVQRSRALTESQSRLAYRETLVGWLRYPLARLRTRVRGSA